MEHACIRHVFLVGDSNMGCISGAHKLAIQNGKHPPCELTSHSLGGGAVAYDLIMTDSGGRRVLNPLLRVALNATRQATKPGVSQAVIALCVGGYVSSVYTWDNRPREFDFLLPGMSEVTVEPRTAFLPAGLVKESLQAHFKVLVEALGVICSETNLPVLYIPGPPPYGDNEEIVQRMSSKRGVSAEKVPHPMRRSVRLKVWKLANEVLREELAKLPVHVVDVPAACMDDHGYLLPEFYGDGFHANLDYGSHMLEALACMPVSGR